MRWLVARGAPPPPLLFFFFLFEGLREDLVAWDRRILDPVVGPYLRTRHSRRAKQAQDAVAVSVIQRNGRGKSVSLATYDSIVNFLMMRGYLFLSQWILLLGFLKPGRGFLSLSLSLRVHKSRTLFYSFVSSAPLKPFAKENEARPLKGEPSVRGGEKGGRKEG